LLFWRFWYPVSISQTFDLGVPSDHMLAHPDAANPCAAAVTHGVERCWQFSGIMAQMHPE
jgi:hypothetical protein